jgi:uncharacterized membrane protein
MKISIFQKAGKLAMWSLFGFFALLMGLFPFICYIYKVPFGVESLKSSEVLANMVWKVNFHIHIIFGAIALLIGWVQFIPKLRERYMALHRIFGKVYVATVLVSGLAGYPICMYASGGLSAFIALMSILTFWLIVTALSYYHAINKRIALHKKWMYYSYASTFASVTLRIWLPSLTFYLGEFDRAYDIATWMAIIPNLLVVRLFFDK